MERPVAELPTIGVVIVTYCAEDFVLDCLTSLRESAYPALRVIVVDNNSPDSTLERVRGWARTALAQDFDELCPQAPPAPPESWLTLVDAGENRGFAGGVNAGLDILLRDPGIELFWILNPDASCAPQTPFAFARRAKASGRFAAIGGRILYAGQDGLIQTDGGRLHQLGFTGVNVNRGRRAADCEMPDPASLDYISGASLVVSRAFIERAGLMDEGWFLYYEEIDWQLRRGDLPLVVEPEAWVIHRAGASIGSGRPDERASPLSVYFMTRNLLPFVARWSPARLPFAYAIAWWKLFRSWGADRARLAALMRGLHRLPPPRAVRARLSDAAWARVFAPRQENREAGRRGTSESRTPKGATEKLP
jgi:GT2 family glycosyltransferase